MLLLFASEDGVLDIRKNLEKSLDFLPSHPWSEQLPGGNHPNFGSYGQQGAMARVFYPGDQWDWALVLWLFPQKLPGDLPVLLLYGSEDGGGTTGRTWKNPLFLPSTMVVQLPSGNHTEALQLW